MLNNHKGKEFGCYNELFIRFVVVKALIFNC